MKRIIGFFCAMLMFLLCSACSNSTSLQQCNENQICVSPKYNVDSKGNIVNFFSTMDALYKQSENYQIYSDETESAFFYIIKDNNDDVLDLGYHEQRGTFDIYERDNKLVLLYGGGGNSWNERYYDVSNGRVSRFFPRPISSTGEKVAYFVAKEDGSIVLVVQNIFDSTEYYEEISRDFSDYVFKDLPVAKFRKQGTELEFTYWIKPKNEMITEVIKLNMSMETH